MLSSRLRSFWDGVYMATSISNGFICGLINILITVTKIRKMIIKAIQRVYNMLLVVGLEFLSLM